jgi:predicted nucleic acid-binding protein
MIVVAGSSPLNDLVLIGEIEQLPSLYQRVLIPKAVHNELMRAQTPLAVRNWAASLPAWCAVRSVMTLPDIALDDLDPGEREAIQLAAEAGVDTVLTGRAGWAIRGCAPATPCYRNAGSPGAGSSKGTPQISRCLRAP